MCMGKDLVGKLMVQDVWTKSKMSVDFDGGKVFEKQTDGHALMTSNS